MYNDKCNEKYYRISSSPPQTINMVTTYKLAREKKEEGFVHCVIVWYFVYSGVCRVPTSKTLIRLTIHLREDSF